jgi:voltage-gated potassium channel
MLLRRLRLAIVLALSVLAVGTLGYVVIGHVSPIDAFYMTVITVTTVGFREVAKPTTAVKLFTIALIFGGVTTLAYTAGILLEFMIEGHLSGLLVARRIGKRLTTLSGHFLIAGYGRVGQEVARNLAAHGVEFVVIDASHDQIAACTEEGYTCVEGDATEGDVLEHAGVLRAKGLIAALDSDADNVFVALVARELNRELFIVARANREESEGKLLKAGADRVLSPSVIGGRRLANLALKPLVSDYLDVITRAEQLHFRLEEFEIGEGSCMVDHSIRESHIRSATGALILAVHNDATGFNTNPPPELVLHARDRLVVMGTEQQLAALTGLDKECRIVGPERLR